MMAQLRITRQLVESMHEDLERPHRFAAERVGMLYCRFSQSRRTGLVILAHHYAPIPDDQYLDDPRFGAVIGSDAFRDVIQHVYDEPVSAFHVHIHPGSGAPRPSLPDLEETAEFVPDFFHGRQDVPHGAIILSQNSLSGRVWFSEHGLPQPIAEIRVVGSPMQRIGGAA